MSSEKNFIKFKRTGKAVLLAIAVVAAVAFVSWQTASTPVEAQESKNNMNHSDRRQKGLRVIDELSGGAGQPVVDEMRKEFPFLADATIEYALGDVWGRKVLDPKTRQLATVAAFAATGTLPQMKIHAGYALNLGATREELKEIIYLTTVHAGFPRALNAAQALKEVFDERDRKTSPKGE